MHTCSNSPVYSHLTKLGHSNKPLVNVHIWMSNPKFWKSVKKYILIALKNQELNTVSVSKLKIKCISWDLTIFQCFVSQCLVDFLVGYWSQSCCKGNSFFRFFCCFFFTFSSSTLWSMLEFMVDYMIMSWPGPVAAKHPPTMTLLLFCTIHIKLFYLSDVIRKYQTFNFRLICTKNIAPEVLVFVY